MDGLDDHPPTGAGPTSLALRLPPAAGPGIGDALVCRDDLPFVRARRTRKALRPRQRSAGLWAPEPDRGTGVLGPEELAHQFVISAPENCPRNGHYSKLQDITERTPESAPDLD